MRHFFGLSRMGVLVGVLAAGCGNGQDLVGSVFVKAVDVVASDGATIEVTAQENQELAGTKLVIPPGSLAEDTRITVALQREDIVLAPDYRAGPVAKWGPAGTVFEIPAELSMPFTLNEQQSELALFFQVVEENGERAEIFASDLVLDGALAAMSVAGFTRYGGGVRGCPSGDPPPPHVDHSCPDGTVCYRGKCEPEQTPTTPEVCDDGVDNDEDGLVDCNDLLDCDQDAACLEPEICYDQIDNDGDGLVDCDDPECLDTTVCSALDYEICYDQIDNDGDGLVDCDDVDCIEDPGCGPRGEICDDQIDNDGDGLVDCHDVYDCIEDPACWDPPAEICDDQIDNNGDGEVDCQDPDCAEHPACVTPPAEICTDQIDNDGDGLVDCADPDCADHQACWYRCEVAIDCPSNCLDQIDNDGDGLVDCDDPGCQGTDICPQP